MSIVFDSIGGTIVTRSKVQDLNKRDQIALFQELLINLGILERFQDEPDPTARAQEIITEQYTKHWG